MPSLLDIFPDPADLLALEPEDLGDLLVELIPSVTQSAGFRIGSFCDQVFPVVGPTYPATVRSRVTNAIAEAVSRLVVFGLVVENHEQPAAGWYLLTRRGRKFDSRAKVAEFRRARVLPLDLLQPRLAEKVWPLFLRGDHDIAVFQAFKIVEVTVRVAANAKGAGYPDDLGGKDLMVKAFNADTGPLRDAAAPSGERQADMFLFAGAMGHARNPTAHHDKNLPAHSAARLIVFASHLLSIVEQRIV